MRREASYLLKLFQPALCSQKQFEYADVGFGALFILILDCPLLFLSFRLPEDTLPLFKMFPPLRRLGQVPLFYVGHIRPYAFDLRVLFARMEGSRLVKNQLGSVPGSLGESDRKHWFRAKFFQQYRLFFRYHQESKIIVYAWVNDENTKRAYGSDADAYRVFQRMLKSGNPPDDWLKLLAEAKRASKQPSKM